MNIKQFKNKVVTSQDYLVTLNDEEITTISEDKWSIEFTVATEDSASFDHYEELVKSGSAFYAIGEDGVEKHKFEVFKKTTDLLVDEEPVEKKNITIIYNIDSQFSDIELGDFDPEASAHSLYRELSKRLSDKYHVMLWGLDYDNPEVPTVWRVEGKTYTDGLVEEIQETLDDIRDLGGFWISR